MLLMKATALTFLCRCLHAAHGALFFSDRTPRGRVFKLTRATLAVMLQLKLIGREFVRMSRASDPEETLVRTAVHCSHVRTIICQCVSKQIVYGATGSEEAQFSIHPAEKSVMVN